MKIKNTERLISVIIKVLALFIFMYSCFRSVVVGITHDEVYSYLMYLPLSVWEVISYDPIYNANNHILNTLLMKWSVFIFGDAEWALRLPNILGHGFYVYFSFRLVNALFDKKYLGLLAFILLNFNPYLIDFFSVARGYGLAMVCMIMSVYFLIRHLKNQKSKYWIAALCFAFLSVWSNFIFLLYFVGLIGIFGIVGLEKLIKTKLSIAGFLKGQIPSGLASIFLAGMITVPMMKLSELKEFRYGGSSSFYKDTFQGLLDNSIYSENYFRGQTLEVFSMLLFSVLTICSALIIYRHIRIRRLLSENSGMIFFLFAALIAIGSILQYHLLGAAYLEDRRAIIFLPFASLILSCGLAQLNHYGKSLSRISAALIIIFSLIHFSLSFKRYDTIREWYYDADTKEVLHILENDSQFFENEKIKIDLPMEMKNSIDFYQKTQNLDWLEPMQYKHSEIVGEGADYYYIFNRQRDKVTDSVEVAFKNKGRVLLRRASER